MHHYQKSELMSMIIERVLNIPGYVYEIRRGKERNFSLANRRKTIIRSNKMKSNETNVFGQTTIIEFGVSRKQYLL